MNTEYKPEGFLFQDAYLGNPDQRLRKLEILSKLAEPEPWDFTVTEPKQYQILRNYLLYTYDRVKDEEKLSYTKDRQKMCFNTGLQTKYGEDIFAVFVKNRNAGKQEWFLHGFVKQSDNMMKGFSSPDIADYFTTPSDFIFDRTLDIQMNYEHIIDDNILRFKEIGYDDTGLITTLLKGACSTIKDKLKRNYKLAIPQFYTNKSTRESKIQLLLPLYIASREEAKLALVVEKSENQYIGKTILTLEWAYMNSRRIVRPEVAWLKIEKRLDKADDL